MHVVRKSSRTIGLGEHRRKMIQRRGASCKGVTYLPDVLAFLENARGEAGVANIRCSGVANVVIRDGAEALNDREESTRFSIPASRILHQQLTSVDEHFIRHAHVGDIQLADIPKEDGVIVQLPVLFVEVHRRLTF
jgi:hypothetical protein